jgi:hypothetical protein
MDAADAYTGEGPSTLADAATWTGAADGRTWEVVADTSLDVVGLSDVNDSIPTTGGLVGFKVYIQLGDTSASTDVWDTGLWDTATWEATVDSQLVDVSQDVEQFGTRMGRQQYVSRFRSGYATVTLDNTDGKWTPATGAPLPGYLPLRPGRTVLITAVTSEGERPLYRGFVDTITDNYARTGRLTTTITCLDWFGMAALNNLPAVSSEGSGEVSSLRMQRIIDHFFNVETAPTLDILPGTVAETTMQGTTLASSALELLQLSAESEGGNTWIAPDGDLQFATFAYFEDRAAGPASWLLGEPNDILIWGMEDTDWSATRIIDETHYSKAGGSEYVASDSTSISRYERRTHQRYDLVTDSDTRVEDIGQRIVDNLSYDRPQLTGLTVIPDNQPAITFGQWVKPGDVVEVTVSTIQGWEYTKKTQVFGVEHSVSPDAWSVSVLLDDTEVEA